jgi:hypothetical protein
MPKFNILDPAREEYRSWKAKKDGLEAKRMRSAVLLTCECCGRPIGPDVLIFEFGGKRACPTCRHTEKVSP